MQLRFILFCVSQAASCDISQTDGVVYLFHISEQTTNNSERRKVFIKLIGGAFPIITHALHFAAAVTKRMMNTTNVPNMIKDMGRNAHVHLSDSPEGVFAKLAPHGFSKERLPPTFGGTYTYEKFQRWISDMKAPPSKVAASLPARAAGLTQMKSRDQGSNQFDVADLPSASETDLSRQMKRGSQDSSVLQSTASSLPSPFQGKRLSDDPSEDHSSKRARGELSTHSEVDNGMDASEVEGKLSEIRKKSALYSKRKYYKKKERVHQLIQDRYHLDAENNRLKEEGKIWRPCWLKRRSMLLCTSHRSHEAYSLCLVWSGVGQVDRTHSSHGASPQTSAQISHR